MKTDQNIDLNPYHLQSNTDMKKKKKKKKLIKNKEINKNKKQL